MQRWSRAWRSSSEPVPLSARSRTTAETSFSATLLASTPQCAHQAFSYGHHVLALQCHPEIRAERFEPWLIGYAADIAATPGVDVAQLRSDTARFAPTLEQATRAMFDEWLDAVESKI